MTCPICAARTEVITSASEESTRGYRVEPFTVRRRRRCEYGHRFWSVEEVEWETTVAPIVGRVDAA